MNPLSHPTDPLLPSILGALRDAREFEALILYGSRACGNFRADSDYNFVGLVGKGGSEKLNLRMAHKDINVQVYNSLLVQSDCDIEELRHFYGSVVVYDPRGIGQVFVDKINGALEAAVVPLNFCTKQGIHVELAADYRKAFGDDAMSWLLRKRFFLRRISALFLLNDAPFLGYKKALALLKRDQPFVYGVLAHALSGQQTDQDIHDWFNIISRVRLGFDYTNMDFSDCNTSKSVPGGEEFHTLDSLEELASMQLREYTRAWQEEEKSNKSLRPPLRVALDEAVEYLKEHYPVRAVILYGSALEESDPDKNATWSDLDLMCFYDDTKQFESFLGNNKRRFPGASQLEILSGLSFASYPASVFFSPAYAIGREQFYERQFSPLSAGKIIYQDTSGWLEPHLEKLAEF